MAETIEYELSALNTLQEETDFKTVDKETVGVEEAENDINSSTALIAYDKNEDKFNIQKGTIMADANSMDGAAVSNEVNTSIPDTAPTLKSTSGTDSREEISGDTGHLTSLAEFRSAASILGKMCEDASKFLTRTRDLRSTVNTSTSRLIRHMEVFPMKVTEFGRGGTDFYDALATDYASFLRDNFGNGENDKMLNMETAVNICIEYAESATKIKVEDVDKTTIKDFAKAICDFLEKERNVCLELRTLWYKVHRDLVNVSKYKVDKKIICTPF